MIKKIIAGAVLLAALTGCATNGSKIDPEQVKQIVAGQTTYDQLVQQFGNPTSQSFSSEGNLQAMWFYIHVGPFGTGIDQQNLVVLFNEDKTVKKYSMANGAPGK